VRNVTGFSDLFRQSLSIYACKNCAEIKDYPICTSFSVKIFLTRLMRIFRDLRWVSCYDLSDRLSRSTACLRLCSIQAINAFESTHTPLLDISEGIVVSSALFHEASVVWVHLGLASQTSTCNLSTEHRPHLTPAARYYFRMSPIPPKMANSVS
jgi:hypothetical protein